MSPCTDELKLVALDKDDIEVISAHVQDALVYVGDVFWRPHDHRFVMALSRFDWMSVADANPQTKPDYRRCRTALRLARSRPRLFVRTTSPPIPRAANRGSSGPRASRRGRSKQPHQQ